MVIELFFADQIVPTGELFRAMQRGTIDAVHSDDDSMASPTPSACSAATSRSPRARFSMCRCCSTSTAWPISGVRNTRRSVCGSRPPGQDPCNFNTKKEITSVADLEGLKLYTFPTAGRFLTQFGVVPVSIPYEDAEVAVQTGELDGMSWSGITEDYTVGWADVTDYFLTNNISGAWIGSWFANEEKLERDLPDHLKQLYMACMEATHTYRNQWYWGGEAVCAPRGQAAAAHRSGLRVEAGRRRRQGVLGRDRGGKRAKAKVISIFKEYNEVINAGRPPLRRTEWLFLRPRLPACAGGRLPLQRITEFRRHRGGHAHAFDQDQDHMAGNLTFDELKSPQAPAISIRCWCACVDMQGRLMGKRFHVQNFIESRHKETHCCNYLLATDLEMARPTAMRRRAGRRVMATTS
jgi:hypothetical protein